MKIHNFSAGPCILPKEVLEKSAAAAINFNDTGLSILEMSHRSKDFVAVMDNANSLVKELLKVPSDYEVLFLGGGASLQFTMTVQNLLPINGKAAFVNTGTWASNAIKEAQLYGEVEVLASSEDKNFCYIPKDFHVPEDCSYLHITTNNTIYGTQYKSIPKTEVSLIADMSSDIFSKEINVADFDLIYAGAQKNIGPAGVTVVIVKKAILGKTSRVIPTILKYQTHIDKESMFNTPPCFPIYVCMLNLEWLKNFGGVAAIEKRNLAKAELLYNEIDRNSIFKGTAVVEDRSVMNPTFVLNDASLDKQFLDLAESKGISGIKGHRSVGGFRASMYNAMGVESVQVLVDAMREFEQIHS